MRSLFLSELGEWGWRGLGKTGPRLKMKSSAPNTPE